MIANPADLGDTLRALRREFDDSFALAPRTHAQAMESLLAIRVHGQPYALRVSDIDGLHADRRVVPLPLQAAHLLGVASFRGRIAPVYDLAALCGYSRAPSSRWLVLLRFREPVALAFETFERHFSVSPQDIMVAQSADLATHPAGAAHVSHAIRHDDTVRPIIQLQLLLADIAQHCDLSHQQRSLST